MEDVQRHSVHTLVFRSLKRSHDMFVSNQALLPDIDEQIIRRKKLWKAKDTYGHIYDRVKHLQKYERDQQFLEQDTQHDESAKSTQKQTENYSSALVPVANKGSDGPRSNNLQLTNSGESFALQPKKAPTIPKPKWHSPWKLYRVISGHLGWIRCVAVEPGNEWFATGAADRVIKIWDLASGKLKLSLTGMYNRTHSIYYYYTQYSYKFIFNVAQVTLVLFEDWL